MLGTALAGLCTPRPGIAQPTPAPSWPTSADEICARADRGELAMFDGRGMQGGWGARRPAPPPPVVSAPVMVSPPAPPPPPPPPPPPVPASSADASGNIVVTGSGAYAPTVPGGSPVNPDRDRYERNAVAGVVRVSDAPVSTFSVDVDTGAYANSRRFILGDNRLPPQDAVRTEELINYFRYGWGRAPDARQPFDVSLAASATPWNQGTRLLRIALTGHDLARSAPPPANIVFLVDVSGSMTSPDKLPLAACTLALAAERLRPQDRMSIVVYAGRTELLLPPTSDRQSALNVLARLSAGGSTAGASGIQLAYATARQAFIAGGVNRIILATDGDFNVGISDNAALVDMVERERASGVQMTTLGYGRGNLNDAMMEQLADKGNGAYAYIDSSEEARKVMDEELASTLFTIAHDVKVQVEFNPAHVSQYRLLGYENRALREEDFNNDAVDAGEIGAGHQVTALYEIVPAGSEGWLPDRRFEGNRRSPEPSSARSGDAAVVALRYKLPGRQASRLIERRVPARMLSQATAPRGDDAFVTAVAAYGQLLRGDTQLGRYGWSDVRALAAPAVGDNRYRRQFLTIVDRAATLTPAGREGAR